MDIKKHNLLKLTLQNGSIKTVLGYFTHLSFGEKPSEKYYKYDIEGEFNDCVMFPAKIKQKVSINKYGEFLCTKNLLEETDTIYIDDYDFVYTTCSSEKCEQFNSKVYKPNNE